MAEKITTHVRDALARLLEQHKGKANIEAVLSGIAGPAQTTEDALWQLFTERSVDNAVGAQLDAIGSIVGEARAGLADDLYRRRVRARIATNRSDGRVSDLLLVATLVLGEIEAQLAIEPQYPAALVFRVLGVALDDDVADVLISFLQQAVSAAVRLLVEYSTAEPDDTLHFALAATSFGPTPIGSYVLVVDSTAGFPSSGTVNVGYAGVAGYETGLMYASKTTTSFTLSPNPTANLHADGDPVVLATGPGKGFPLLVTFVDDAVLAGSSTLDVDSTSGFPASGVIDIDVGTADEETIEYASYAGNTFTLVGVLAKDHDDRAPVTIARSVSDNPDSGGRFATVRET